MYSVEFLENDRWNSGFNGSITIGNESNVPLDDWTLEFESNFEISNFWNAEIVSHNGSKYVVRALDWNKQVAANNSISIEFSANASSDVDLSLSNVQLNNSSISLDPAPTPTPEPVLDSTPTIPKPQLTPVPEPISEPAPSSQLTTPPTNSAPADIDFSVANNWGSGFTGGLEITNLKSTAIDGWQLEFEADFDITNICGLKIFSYNCYLYTIENVDYNTKMATGEPIKIGFNANGSPEEPSNFVLNDNAVSDGEGNGNATPPESEPNVPSEPDIPEVTPTPPSPPNFSSPDNGGDYNYGESLQKSLLFIEAQRSGNLPEENRIAWRGDSAVNDGADVGVDLSGGYYDAGDHVKFGLPMASSITLLSWGVMEYREAYEESGQLDEVLAAIKWGTDFFLKAHETNSNGTTALWGQVGNGGTDHAYWGSAESMTMERPAYKIDSNNPGSDLAGETAAALAAASIVFKSTDANYANKLLTNAKQLYDFADTYRGKYSDSITDAANYYNSWSGYEDELAWGAAWLTKAGESGYLSKAKAAYTGVTKGWTQSWDNKSHGTAILLAQETGNSQYRNDAEAWLDHWSNRDGNGITYTDGGLAWLDQWGSLRYSANTAFLAGIYSDTVNDYDNRYSNFAQGQVDYILGDNPNKFSYQVGFGDDFALNPHHRGASGTTDINSSAPNEHILYGALVGGPSSPNDYSYSDERTNYITNEVALDYNAGFTGAVARSFSLYGGEPLNDTALAALPEVMVA